MGAVLGLRCALPDDFGLSATSLITLHSGFFAMQEIAYHRRVSHVGPPLFRQAPHLVDQSGPSPSLIHSRHKLPLVSSNQKTAASSPLGLTEVEDGRVQCGTGSWECRFLAIEFGSDVQ